MYIHQSISDLREKLLCGELDCITVVASYLEAINSNKHLNAFVEVYEAEAMDRARMLDKKNNKPQSWGKLYGVVIGIKDVLCYNGHHVGASSKILEG